MTEDQYMNASAPSLSIVVPLYNEEENVTPLVEQVHDALGSYEGPWELILVNDGSSDQTAEQVRAQMERYGDHIRLVSQYRNHGQTAAMQAGIDLARGDLIATLDGDLQNDPADIPRMVEELQRRRLDLLTGWRKNRKDALILRKIPSRIANRLISRVTGVVIHDYGCSLKVYRGEVLRRIRLMGEMHRFIPVWLAMVTSPARIDETVVNHRPRIYGVSKYGISRTFRVILDLLTVFFFLRFNNRPGHFFGMIGITLGAIGSGGLLWLFVEKFIFDADIGTRPLLLLSVLFVVASIQFITTGILAEMITRSGGRTGHDLIAEEPDAPDWYQSDR